MIDQARKGALSKESTEVWPGFIKLGLCGIVIIFSGFLDSMGYVVNPAGIPEVIQYARHIKIFSGHYPKYIEGVYFALLHIQSLLMIIVVLSG